MKTMVMNYAEKLDKAIPDATLENVITRSDDIRKEALTAAECAAFTVIMTGTAVMHTTELATIIAKTAVKNAVIKSKEFYEATDTAIVRR